MSKKIKKCVLFSYSGHKQPKEIKLFDKYIKDINNYNLIVEPFCGHFGFSSFYCDNFKGNYVLNDLNKMIIDIYEDIKNDKLDDYLNILENFRKNNEYNGKKYINEFEVRKRLFFVNKAFIKDLDLNKKEDYVLYNKFNFMGNMIKLVEKPINKKNYQYIEDIIKKSTLLNEDFKDCINKYKDNEKALIYLDPPYLNSYNKNYNYSNKKNDENKNIIDYTKIYIDILKLLQDKSIKATIILSLNSNAIIDYLFNDYIIERFEKIYQRTKRKEYNLIISNKKL